MVFNTIHGVDPKDPSTVTTPFQFDRTIKLSSLRIGVDSGAPKEFVDVLRELGAVPKEIGARPSAAGGGFGAESAAAFDFYVQAKAKEFGVDLATLPEPARGGGAGGRAGGGAGGGAGAAGRAGTAGATDPAGAATGRAGAGGGAPGAGGGGRGNSGRATSMADLTRWTGGRFQRAFEFVQQQRRRQILITQMAELLKDFDMYVPGGGYDVGLHAQTGHPCVVLPYKFDSPPTGGGGGRGAGGGGRSAGAAAATPTPTPTPTPSPTPVVYNKQPICAVLAGNLYNDDKILSVAHQYQLRTAWHKERPALA